MDNIAHSLVGLTSAKAGLDRLSPYATAVCVISANAADADFVSLLGDRWTLLQYHRGMTHSVVGTIAIGILIPALAYAIERIVSSIRKRAPRIRFLGRSAVYLQTLAMSFSFMLLLVPGTNETLSRLPVGHPLASGIDSPIVKSALAGLFVLFLIGTAYQMFKLAGQRRSQIALGRTDAPV